MRCSKSLIRGAFVFFCLSCLNAGSVSAGNPVGHLGGVRGLVKLNGRVVRGSVPIENGQVIETGEDSGCTLLLGKSNVVHLGPNSRLEMSQHILDGQGNEDTRLNLEKGSTRSLIRDSSKTKEKKKKTFSIRSRSAVMGVRGTHIYLETPESPAEPQRFATFEGVAAVQLGSMDTPSIELKANEMMSSAPLPGTAAPETAPAPSVQKIQPEESKRIAAQVAPPPPEIRTPQDTVQLGMSQDGERDLKRKLDRQQQDQFRPRFDPLADAVQVPVGIDISAKRSR